LSRFEIVFIDDDHVKFTDFGIAVTPDHPLPTIPKGVQWIGKYNRIHADWQFTDQYRDPVYFCYLAHFAFEKAFGKPDHFTDQLFFEQIIKKTKGPMSLLTQQELAWDKIIWNLEESLKPISSPKLSLGQIVTIFLCALGIIGMIWLMQM